MPNYLVTIRCQGHSLEVDQEAQSPEEAEELVMGKLDVFVEETDPSEDADHRADDPRRGQGDRRFP